MSEEPKDNGGLKKTVDEIEAEKKAEAEKAKMERDARFYADPDSFVEIKDLMVAAMDSPQGIATLVGKGVKRTQLEIIQSRINHLIMQEFIRMDIIAFKKVQEDKRIILAEQNKNNKGKFRRFIGGR